MHGTRHVEPVALGGAVQVRRLSEVVALLQRHGVHVPLADQQGGAVLVAVTTVISDDDVTTTMTVKAQRRQLERKRERLTRLQIERGDITKACATALRKVHWPHILHQHCTCEDDGLCKYSRAKHNAGGSKGGNSRHPSQAAQQVH